MTPSTASPVAPDDRTIRLLEAGLVAVVVLAPVPFASVPPAARTAVEAASALLLAGWTVRALFRQTVLPSRWTLAACAGLLVLAAAQLAPLGAGVVSWLSPHATALREAVRPGGEALAAEARLIGADPVALDAVPTLSLEPASTASALRTGTALVALLVVATAVGATAGPRRTAAALVGAAAIQGLYGILVLASDEPRILHLPKQHYLDCATGTFVNRNHYAGWLAMALACGLALLLDEVARIRSRARGARPWAGPEAGKVLLLGLALVVGTAGLLTSFSRAGIAVGVLALGLTALAGTGAGRLRTRIAVALVVAAAGVLPLLQLGSEKLVARYADTAEHLVSEGGRARVWSDGLRMAGAFPASGTGFGTFAAAYPAFRSADVRFFYAHAHNDLVQVAAEAGIVGSILVLALVVSVGRALVRAFRGACGITGVGVAAAVVALLLHALVDFHFHVPANAATAAVLVGLLEGMAWRQNAST